jgi:hypothetical protein
MELGLQTPAAGNAGYEISSKTATSMLQKAGVVRLNYLCPRYDIYIYRILEKTTHIQASATSSRVPIIKPE